MIGRVIYSSGGNYRVLVKNDTFNAKPLGIFRKSNIKIIVGDIVEIQVNENKTGREELNTITKLFERKNEFQRPNISNVDNVILVTSITEPNLNDYYLDKLITIFQSRSIKPILIFTKGDLGISKDHKKIIDEYKDANFKVIITYGKSLEKEEMVNLKNWTKDKLSIITGQTGVGKSTLLNFLNDKFNLKTGEISKVLGRGKHTTRHSEAFEIFPNSYIVDTPGFSSLDIKELDKSLICWNFFNFEQFANNCKFNNCQHSNEKGCNIKKQTYSERTMINYKKLLEELD